MENETPQLDADSPEFDAAVREGRFDAEEAPQDESGEVGGPSPLLAALEEVEGTPPATEAPNPESVEPRESQEQAQTPPAEDWQRKYNSVAGNNRQLQQLVAQERQERQQLADRLAQMERTAQTERDLAQIRQSVPAELQDEAIADYRRRTEAAEREQGLEAYRGYLQQQQAQMAQAQVGLFRQALPHDMPDFVAFVAERAQSPAEPLIEMLQTDAFREVYGMVDSQRDLDLIAQVILAQGQVEAKRDRQRKEQNRQQAVATGAHREVATGAGGSGSSGQDIKTRINQMSDEQFLKFSESVSRQGGLRGL